MVVIYAGLTFAIYNWRLEHRRTLNAAASEAAGTAVALAVERNLPSLAAVPAAALRERLAAQHVELSWPRSPELLAHLRREDD